MPAAIIDMRPSHMNTRKMYSKITHRERTHNKNKRPRSLSENNNREASFQAPFIHREGNRQRHVVCSKDGEGGKSKNQPHVS